MNKWKDEQTDKWTDKFKLNDEYMKWWKAGWILNGWKDEMVKGRINTEWMNRWNGERQDEYWMDE